MKLNEDEDVDIDVSDLIIKPVEEQVDAYVDQAIQIAMSNQEVELQSPLRKEAYLAKKLTDTINPKTIETMRNERSGMPSTN